MLLGLRRVLVALCAMTALGSVRAQEPVQEQPAPDAGTYTLHANARVVLTDVTVTDRNGNPVAGLGRSAFHIFDNGHAQQLRSFEEHRGGQPVDVAGGEQPGVFSNAIILHPPPVFNVIVLDTTTIGIVDQMYLYEEITKFVNRLPAEEPLAIYNRGAENTVLLQNFTADHKLLMAAIQKAIPRLTQPGSGYANDMATLQQIAVYLSQYPGRKNVLWFSGGSKLFLRSDPNDVPPSMNLQPIYDDLEAARIAIYPIDARGLTVTSPPRMIEQHMLMDEVASATGGRAFYNNNGLSLIASRVVASDASFYTLTYTPHDVRFDNSWHKVKVQLDASGYKLSYRRGYYDDGANAGPNDESGASSRKRLLANGETAHAPELHKEPIVFSVGVTPSNSTPLIPGTSVAAPAKRGEFTYTLHYSVPAQSVTANGAGASSQAVLGTAVLAMGSSGHAAARLIQRVTLTFDEQRAKNVPDAKLGFDQQINLPKGEVYLYVAVWDAANGRLGTVQIPLNVTKPSSK